MGWDGMGWDGMGWDGMGWDGMGWGQFSKGTPYFQFESLEGLGNTYPAQETFACMLLTLQRWSDVSDFASCSLSRTRLTAPVPASGKGRCKGTHLANKHWIVTHLNYTEGQGLIN